MVKFRFQDLKIWQLSIEIAHSLFDIADEFEKKKLYRFAEQLRGAGLSMSNNIAEGSGSDSKREFKHFLNIAKRSTFEKNRSVHSARNLPVHSSHPSSASLATRSLPSKVSIAFSVSERRDFFRL